MTTINKSQLTHFTVLNNLDESLKEDFIREAIIERYPPGRRLFIQGQEDNRSYFLLAGQIGLIEEDKGSKTLKADTHATSQPIADQQPRNATAIASTNVQVISIDYDVFKKLRTHNREVFQSPQIKLGDEILQTPLFHRLPDAHLQVIAQRLVEIDVKKGDTIINIDEKGHYFYMIKSGRCEISRLIGRDQNKVVLTELGPTQSFGERALIANAGHTAAVTMLEDGQLLRISRGEFLTLMVEPFTKRITLTEALENTEAVILDARSRQTFQRERIPTSINLPLAILYNTVALLDKNVQYIVYCDTLVRRTLAAYLMAQQGLQVRMLEKPQRKKSN